jgi:hypothetical protein
MTTRRNSCLAVFALLLFSLTPAGFAQSVTVVPATRSVATVTNSGFGIGVAFDAAGNMYFTGGSNVYKVAASTGLLSTFAGNGGNSPVQDGVAPTATAITPVDVKVDNAGNIYIADEGNQAIRVVNMQTSAITLFGTNIQPGMIQTVAGTLSASGADASHLFAPFGIFLDGSGNLWIADEGNNAVRKVALSGTMTTIAGQLGLAGNGGDGGLATSAKLSAPEGVAVDSQGNLYIGDFLNNTIRVVNTNPVSSPPKTVFGVSIPAGDINTVAGNTGLDCGYAGDGGPSTSAIVQLCHPSGVTLDAAGNLLDKRHWQQRCAVRQRADGEDLHSRRHR